MNIRMATEKEILTHKLKVIQEWTLLLKYLNNKNNGNEDEQDVPVAYLS